jgi:hypothetical protein
MKIVLLASLALLFAAAADSPFPIPDGTPFKLLPCKTSNPRTALEFVTTPKPDGPPVSSIHVAGAEKGRSCVSCPGENGKGTDACHTWGGCGTDRNDCFLVNATATSKPFRIFTYPETKSFPTGKGLMAPGQCLVPQSAGGSLEDGVVAKQCTATTDADALWVYDKATKLLKHNHSGLCLDGGTAFELNCWSTDSPTSSFPMCDTTLDATQRALDFVSRMTLAEKGHNLGGAGGWGGSAGVPRLGVPEKAALQSSEALHGLGQASCGKQTYHKEFDGNNTGCPASFPHNQALGCTFNRSLWGLIGDRISTEARAAVNTGHLGALWLWAPNINLFKVSLTRDA